MKVGFIGLGIMGSSMAANLQRAGHEVLAHDLRKVEGFPRWANSPAEAEFLAETDVAFVGSIPNYYFLAFGQPQGV